jgi:hypothetical protein
MSSPSLRQLETASARFAGAVQRLPLTDTLRAVEQAVDLTLDYPEAAE